jgi:hypothetical protein
MSLGGNRGGIKTGRAIFFEFSRYSKMRLSNEALHSQVFAQRLGASQLKPIFVDSCAFDNEKYD